MVVLLHLVAIAMIAIGGAAILFGSEIVLTERGWSMLIAGSVGASSGAVLLGVATVARVLRRLQRDVEAFRTADDRAGEQPRRDVAREETAIPVVVGPDTSPGIGLRGSLAPHDPAATATPAWTDTAFAVPPPDIVEPPVVQQVEPPRRSVASRRERTGPPGETITKVRDRVFVREASVAPEPESQAALESLPGPAPSVPPAPPAAPEPLGVAEPPGAAAAPEPVLARDRKVIGQYSSGGNAYIMYADGSIEADTPSGRYLFGSLEELKAFVSVGGENEPKVAQA